MSMDMIRLENELVLARIGDYLTRRPRAITPEDVQEITFLGVSEEYAVALLLFSLCGFDAENRAHRTLFDCCFLPAVKREDADLVQSDPFMALPFPEKVLGKWQYTRLQYAPMELFVRDDLALTASGRILPALGYFTETVSYPAVLEDGREWMTVTPNEIRTMQKPISNACGKCVTYGLGLGYFAFHAAMKEDVTSLTVVEQDQNAIALFETHLLPHIPMREKITLVQGDAFDHAQKHLGGFDYAFTDLWHDAGDGVNLYLQMQEIAGRCPQTKCDYWIEKTLKLYL